MSAFADFLQRLFSEGVVAYREPPESASPDDYAAQSVLERAFAAQQLQVAGPALTFSLAPAAAAAALLWRAGWFLFSRQEPEEVLNRLLTMPGPPVAAEDHLSADVILRYLPALYRRAHSADQNDCLVRRLATVLRQWPLSGVLADLADGPTTPLDFAGHPGLLLVYAERLVGHEKQAWVPPGGKALEYVELVYAALGRTLPHPVLDTLKPDIKDINDVL